MTNRNGARDEDCDMLVIGRGLGGSVVALQLTKKRCRRRLLAVGRRSPDEHLAEVAWDIKRLAWAPLGLKGTRHILWLPKVVVFAGVGVVGCLRVLQRMKNSLVNPLQCTASTDSETLPPVAGDTRQRG
jgi:choline dehydrogenase-like flavoprotein